ncbi:MAG: hypothetical protein LBQ60_11830 [Bacteroidales bacterium]|jgi:hypothetical protein|nr:hypothetical protein [Bacteroidales bacterium]
MNKFLLFALFGFIATGLAMAQSDCMPFYPEEGTVMISKSYDAQKNLLNTTTYTVESWNSHEFSDEVTVRLVTTDNKGTAIDLGRIFGRCEGGNFYLNMTNKGSFPEIAKLFTSNTELVGNFIDYPNTFGTAPYVGDFATDGGEFTIWSKVDKKASVRVRIYNRFLDEKERISTPAGKFDASKIKFTFEVTEGKKKTTYKGVEWYALNAGVVRSETYDSKNNLISYSEMTNINRPNDDE